MMLDTDVSALLRDLRRRYESGVGPRVASSYPAARSRSGSVRTQARRRTAPFSDRPRQDRLQVLWEHGGLHAVVMRTRGVAESVKGMSGEFMADSTASGVLAQATRASRRAWRTYRHRQPENPRRVLRQGHAVGGLRRVSTGECLGKAPVSSSEAEEGRL